MQHPASARCFAYFVLMAPDKEIQTQIGANNHAKGENNAKKPARLSMEGLQRSISDISFELSKEPAESKQLPPITEVEDATCECCGMSEECTAEYINCVRNKFAGKLICGLCGSAVNEEIEKNGGKREEALHEHMSACVKFKRFGRSYPVLFQAEAIKEILKKTSTGAARAKSMSPRDSNGSKSKGKITRSSSCMPAISREIGDQTNNMIESSS